MVRPTDHELPRPNPNVQLKALLRKNAILFRRRKRDKIREIGIPIVLLVVLVVLRLSMHNEKKASRLDYPAQRVSIANALEIKQSIAFGPCSMSPNTIACEAIPHSTASSSSNRTFLATKKSDVDSVAVRQIATSIAHTTGVSVYCCGTSESAVDISTHNRDTFPASVTFEKLQSLNSATDDIHYSIHLDVDKSLGFDTSSNFSSTYDQEPNPDVMDYNTLFVPVQSAVNKAIMDVSHTSGASPRASSWSGILNLVQFPSFPYTDNAAARMLSSILPIYMVIIFSLQIRVLLGRILEEKEKKITEGMKMIGMSTTVMWASWLISHGIINGIIVALIIAVSFLGNLLQASNWVLVLIYYLLFMLNCIAFSFVLTSFFSKSRTGGAFGMIMYLILSTPSYAFSNGSGTSAEIIVACLLPPTAFSVGNKILVEAEKVNNSGSAVGIHWSNLFDTTTHKLSVSFGSTLIMLIVDLIILLFLAWYFDQVIPNEFGTNKPFYFLCSRRYWKKRRRTSTDDSELLGSTNEEFLKGWDASEASIEPISNQASYTVGVHIQNLTKEFPIPASELKTLTDGSKSKSINQTQTAKVKRAVDNLSFDMYQDQITCLLGHNGAGKTTTISMLTGLFEPSNGDAAVYGRSISDDIDGVRQLIGVCPQQDILFDDTTVIEHLQLYAGLKGLSGPQVDEDINALCESLGLTPKMDSFAMKLSGGQKRKLSVAMALIGAPKVVFLDEPTSGMDPASRRTVWNLLQRAKQGRVIILTTHFMDEADILGDRIAIMSRGRLKVLGSSLFLKTRFGVGYTLTMTACASLAHHQNHDPKNIPQWTEIPEVKQRVQNIFAMVQQFIPLAKIEDVSMIATQNKRGQDSQENEAGSEQDKAWFNLVLVLPLDGISKFGGMFEVINERKNELQIGDYGISVTSLEEVFLRLAEAEATAEANGLTDSAEPLRNLVGGESTSTTEQSYKVDGIEAASAAGPEINLNSPTSKNQVAKAAKKYMLASNVVQESTNQYTWLVRISALLWRRFRAATRDKRGLWLQMVLPLCFVAISFTFTSLQDISSTNSLSPVYFSANALDTYNSAGVLYTDDILGQNYTVHQDYKTIMENDWKWDITHGSIPPPVFTSAGSDLPSAIYNTGDLAAGFKFSVYPSNSTTLDSAFFTNLYCNTSFTNGIPAFVNMWYEAVFKYQQNISSNVKIRSDLQPLPRPKTQKASLGNYLSSSFMGFYLSLGLCTIPALQAVNVVRESSSGVKMMQSIMKMGYGTYWFGTWLWDFIQFLVPWVGGTIILTIFSYATNAFPAFIIKYLSAMLLCYGAAVPVLTYAISFKFDNPVTAQTYIMAGFYLFTTASFFAIFSLSLPSASESTQNVANGLRYVFYFFPNFALAYGFSTVISDGIQACLDVPDGMDCSKQTEFSFNSDALVFLISSSFLYAIIIVILEKSALGQVCSRHRYTEDPEEKDESPLESDVASEQYRVEEDIKTEEGTKTRLQDSYGARAVGLTKAFPDILAVDKLTFGVSPGECFGLLGHNGAGKTTTLKMLTTYEVPTSGYATLTGYDTIRETDKARSVIGYCSQSDALFPLLSGEEVLRYYARLRGINTPEALDKIVDAAIEAVGLEAHRKLYTQAYSGGNKRKLSFAIAYMAAPKVVFLDEPSTGMDPVARRRMWNIVREGRTGRSTIITTHWMEEADVLCDRIGIMVNGRFACLGSSQHLKNKFGQGYRLEAKLENPAKTTELLELSRTICPTASVYEQHQGHVVINLHTDCSALAAIFGVLQKQKDSLTLRDYAVSQTTLEQVFLKMAENQRPTE